MVRALNRFVIDRIPCFAKMFRHFYIMIIFAKRRLDWRTTTDRPSLYHKPLCIVI